MIGPVKCVSDSAVQPQIKSPRGKMIIPICRRIVSFFVLRCCDSAREGERE